MDLLVHEETGPWTAGGGAGPARGRTAAAGVGHAVPPPAVPGHALPAPAVPAPAVPGRAVPAPAVPAAVPGAVPAANLAWEEALVRSAPSVPVLRLWRNPACLVLGRAQRAEREVDLAACQAAGVPVLRRASGGGTVYHDLGNLNISLAVPGWRPHLAAELSALVTAALAALGLAATAGERGVFVGAAKVSGLASQVTAAGSMAHATLLVTTPARHVTAFLAPPPRDSRPTDSRRSPVAALRDLGCGADVPMAHAAVTAAAAARYGPLRRRTPTSAERRWQQRLLAERYYDDCWHLTGRTKEAPWMTRPALTCTG